MFLRNMEVLIVRIGQLQYVDHHVAQTRRTKIDGY